VGNPEARFDIVAGDKTRAAFKTFNGSLKTSGTNVKRLTAGVLGLVGVGGIGALIKVNADAADSNAKFADKLGISTEKLAGLRYGIGQIAGDAGGFEEALTKASKRLGEFNATGGGAGAVWLKKLSLDTQELAQLKPDELFLKYAESVRGLNDRGQQLAAMSALMGDESRKFITVIDEGPDALLAYAAEAEALGIALNRVDTAKIEAANDAIDRSSKVFAGVGTRMAVELAPFFEVASNNFADLAVENNGFRDQILSGTEAIAIGVGYLGNSWRGWELIWKGLAVGWLDFQSGTMDGLAAMDRGITSVADILPGLDAAPNEDLQKWAISGRVELGAARAELLVLASAPMPVDQVKAFFDTVRAESQAAGEEVAAKRKALVEGFSGGEEGGDSGGMTAAQEKALSTHRLFLAGRIEATEQAGKSENQRFFESLQNRELMLQEAQARGVGSEERNAELLVGITQQREAKVLSITRAAIKENEKAEKARAKARIGIATGMLGNLSTLMNSDSKKQFELGKKAALAGALVSGAEAVVSSYAAGAKIGGPWLGAAYAATAAIATKMHIDAIRSRQFGGGGAVSGGGGAGGGAQPVFNADPISGLPSQQQQSGAVSNIYIPDLPPSGNVSVEMVDAMLDAIEDRIKNGDKVIIHRGSRQAQEILAA